MEPVAYEEMFQNQESHWWFRARRKILNSELKRLDLPRNAKILEVGAGPGGNLGLLKQFGEVSAIEMDSAAREMARSQFPNARIEYGRLPDELPYADEKFDLIVLLDVLEHIDEDGKALEALAKLLKSGGRLLITVPAYQWMWSVHDVQLHHKRRYTAKRLSAVIENSGWRLGRLTYFNTLLFPIAAATRLVDKAMNKKTASGNQLPSKPINSALEIVFAAERHILDRATLPMGLSLLAVATL